VTREALGAAARYTQQRRGAGAQRLLLWAGLPLTSLIEAVGRVERACGAPAEAPKLEAEQPMRESKADDTFDLTSFTGLLQLGSDSGGKLAAAGAPRLRRDTSTGSTAAFPATTNPEAYMSPLSPVSDLGDLQPLYSGLSPARELPPPASLNDDERESKAASFQDNMPFLETESGERKSGGAGKEKEEKKDKLTPLLQGGGAKEEKQEPEDQGPWTHFNLLRTLRNTSSGKLKLAVHLSSGKLVAVKLCRISGACDMALPLSALSLSSPNPAETSTSTTRATPLAASFMPSSDNEIEVLSHLQAANNGRGFPHVVGLKAAFEVVESASGSLHPDPGGMGLTVRRLSLPYSRTPSLT
jgi:hypothetical protein